MDLSLTKGVPYPKSQQSQSLFGEIFPVLESFGYTVLTAASGGKGLELASKYSVDVVILD